MTPEYTFAFVSEAAAREYKQLPDEIMDEFGKNFRLIQFGEKPEIPLEHLSNIGAGIMELKINGSPAFRSVFITKFNDCLYVLHSFKKTTNGPDKKAMKLVAKRYKLLMEELGRL